MRVRAHRRNLVVCSPSVGPAHRYGAPKLTRLPRTRRIHRFIHTGALLTVTGVMLRSGAWGALILPGLLFLYSALLIPARPDADRKRRSELERELAGYSTPAQRCDLEATLDRYPDSVTYELRDILASQAMASCNNGIPGARRGD